MSVVDLDLRKHAIALRPATYSMAQITTIGARGAGYRLLCSPTLGRGFVMWVEGDLALVRRLVQPWAVNVYSSAVHTCDRDFSLPRDTLGLYAYLIETLGPPP